MLATAIVTLLAIPLVRMGLFNDFAMRASIPALCVMAILVTEAFLVQPWRKTLPLLVVFVLGIGTGANEIYRGFDLPRKKPAEASLDIILLKTGLPGLVHSQYFAPYPNWFLR